MFKKKLKKYWVVNNSKKEAVSAVRKLIKAQKESFDIVELSDAEYHSLGNPEACRYIRDEE